MNNNKILAAAIIGLTGVACLGFGTQSWTKIARAASDTVGKTLALRNSGQSISDIAITSNNKDKGIAAVGNVLTISYTLDNVPVTNKVIIDNQVFTPVCEGSSVQKCSTAVIVTNLFPTNDGVIKFSINALFKGAKVETVATASDKTFVNVQRQKVTIQQQEKQKDTSVVADNSPTLANVLRLNSIITKQSKSVGAKSSSEMLKNNVGMRAQAMVALAKKNPQEFIYGMFPADIAKKLGTSFPGLVEANVTESGILEVIYVDDFKDEKNSHLSYTLHQGGASMTIYSAMPLDFKSGEIVTVTGSRIGNSIVVKSNNQISAERKIIPTSVSHADSVGRQNTLVFLIRFPDSGPAPFSRRTAERLVFQGQFQKFMKEQSYRNVSFSGKVLDWMTVDRNSNADQNSACSASSSLLSPQIQNAITDNHIQLADYGRVLFLVDGQGGCSSVGKSYFSIDNIPYRLSESSVGTSNYAENSYGLPKPFPWTNLDFVLSHEMGHALGLWHASGWECGEAVLRGNCEHLEYGNSYDTMGTNSYTLHFNAFYKETLGWIKPSEIETITQSGTYTIKPLEDWLLDFLFSAKRIAKIRILNSDSTPLYLEYRKPSGFDGGLDGSEISSNKGGLFINYVTRTISGNLISRLLDMTPHVSDSQSFNFDDIKNVTLKGNAVFSDPDTGISIGPVIQNTASKITFKVNMTTPTCIRRTPLIINPQGSGYAGYPGYLRMNVHNQDSFACDDSEFYIDNIVLPSGWSILQRDTTAVISPEQEKYLGFSFEMAPGVVSGTTQSISLDLVRSADGSRTSVQIPIIIQ